MVKSQEEKTNIINNQAWGRQPRVFSRAKCSLVAFENIMNN
jgi:hypothetical protein